MLILSPTVNLDHIPLTILWIFSLSIFYCWPFGWLCTIIWLFFHFLDLSESPLVKPPVVTGEIWQFCLMDTWAKMTHVNSILSWWKKTLYHFPISLSAAVTWKEPCLANTEPPDQSSLDHWVTTWRAAAVERHWEQNWTIFARNIFCCTKTLRSGGHLLCSISLTYLNKYDVSK